MRVPILLVCLGLTGCSRKLAPTCDVVADHVQTLFGGASDDYAKAMRGVFVARCTDDQWADDMRSCVVATQSLTEPKNCKLKLTPEQSTKLEAAIAASDEEAEMKIVPGVCARYEKMLADVMTCDALPPEARADLRKAFDEFKATWPSTPDKRTLGVICSSAIASVKMAAGTCPNAKKW